MEIVQREGTRQVKHNLDFYNFDMIILGRYCVNSRRETKFRICAISVLKECGIKGFVMF